MFEHAIETGMAAYGAFWSALNLYNFSSLAYLKGRPADGIDYPALYDEIEKRPAIDVLVPAYEEDEVIDLPLNSIRNAAYDHDLIDVHVLLEPDDERTPTALDELAAEYEFETITVPASYPGEPNKPRALNYAFEQTDNEVVGVIDAEDVVADDLFQQVVVELVAEDNDYAQARLDMANEDDGWLNTMFRGEYGNWYNTVVPGYVAADWPVPLGGTSCFFKRPVLEDASAARNQRYGPIWDDEDRQQLTGLGLDGTTPWNPDNVTEDFELGLLLWEEGYDLAYLEATTVEESPIGYRDWLRQRTRWQKGKLQTLRQYLDGSSPDLRTRAHTGVQSALPHLGPINLSGAALGVYTYLAGVDLDPAVDALLGAGLLSATAYMGLQARGYHTVTETGKEDPDWRRRFAANGLTLPAYWMLQWAADIRAVTELYTGDTDWEKTEHHGRHESESARAEDLKV